MRLVTLSNVNSETLTLITVNSETLSEHDFPLGKHMSIFL